LTSFLHPQTIDVEAVKPIAFPGGTLIHPHGVWLAADFQHPPEGIAFVSRSDTGSLSARSHGHEPDHS
jgi:hypothetical protein